MALVVESTSTVATSTADNLTITKPVGVSSGDLLVIVTSSDFDFNSPSNFPTCSGFTLQVSQAAGTNNVNPKCATSFLWRIADSSDVSASTYTVAFAGSTSLGASVMFRISGWTTGNPVFTSSTFSTTFGATTINHSSSLARPSAQLLIMAGVGNYSSVRTVSGYQITSSDSNPTWTELQDTNLTVGGEDIISNVAYANSSSTSTITSWGYSYSSSLPTSVAAMLIVICQPLSATASNALFQTTPDTFATLTGSTQEPTNDFQAVEPEIFSQSARGTNPTQWRSDTLPTTDWSNKT